MTNTIKRTTYKIVGNFNICGKERTCLIRLCCNEEDAKHKLQEVLENKNVYIKEKIIGEPYIVAEDEDGTEWYYGLTD